MATTPVFLPGEYHGQSSLVGFSPQGWKELDMTEATEHACIYMTTYIDKLSSLYSSMCHGREKQR